MHLRSGQQRREPVHFLAQLAVLLEPPARYVAMVDQAMPELLGADRSASPAEMHERVGTARDALPCKRPNKPRLRRSPHREPAAWRAADRLHDPEVPLLIPRVKSSVNAPLYPFVSDFLRTRVRIIVKGGKVQRARRVCNNQGTSGSSRYYGSRNDPDTVSAI